jgi:hypothetical protein
VRLADVVGYLVHDQLEVPLGRLLGFSLGGILLVEQGDFELGVDQ